MSKKSQPKKKIFILDDEKGFIERLKAQLDKVPTVKKAFEVVACVREEFVSNLLILEKRQRAIRDNVEIPKVRSQIFDAADILVVDYDLARLLEGIQLPVGVPTGERVAYLARCFSECGLIIALNQFNEGGQPLFDLTLCGHPRSFADLNLGSKELDNPGLWKTEWVGYRPWHWPLLPDAVDCFERRTARLARVGLEVSIFDHIELPPYLPSVMPIEILQWLAPWSKKVEDVTTVTFADFLKKSQHGLDVKDQRVTNSLYASRVASARIGKWLERFVLGGQGILVDAPHLVARFPSLLKGKSKPTREDLNLTCQIGHQANPSIDERHIKACRFRAVDWLSRPAWFWDQVRSCDEIVEVKEPWKKVELDSRFCEDVSAFVPEKKCQEFSADTPGTYARRFIAKVDRVDYSPEMKLAL
jgi:hypothetical protein